MPSAAVERDGRRADDADDVDRFGPRTPPVAGAPDPDVVHRVAPRGGALGPRAAQPAGGPRRAAPGVARRGAARRRGLARLRRTHGWCFEPGTAGSIGEVLL